MTAIRSRLVGVRWLREHTAQVVILDASIRRGGDGEPEYGSGRTDFERSHIPGAHFADLFTEFSDPESPLPFTRPTRRQLTEAARRAGITDGTQVVVYDRLNGAWAARLWWVLESFGFDTVRVLDGGLPAWIASGFPVETGATAPIAAGVGPTLHDHGHLLAGLDEVTAASRQPGTRPLVCGLRRTRFAGHPDDPGSGHIPNSVSLPYDETLDASGHLSPTSVRRLADRLGLDQASRPILYCGGGVNAAGVALALNEIGLTDAAIFDGSLAEWRADPTRPLEVDAERT